MTNKITLPVKSTLLNLMGGVFKLKTRKITVSKGGLRNLKVFLLYLKYIYRKRGKANAESVRIS